MRRVLVAAYFQPTAGLASSRSFRVIWIAVKSVLEELDVSPECFFNAKSSSEADLPGPRRRVILVVEILLHTWSSI